MLRKLQKKDISGMLEWMHDSDVNQYFRFDAAATTEKDAYEFIEKSFTEECRNYAVVDDLDEYLGTISLKNINLYDKNAEYAISLRQCARGKKVAEKATSELLNIAFEELGLEKVYLNVLSTNIRAIKFYEKAGFVKEGLFGRHVMVKGILSDLEWYAIWKEKFYEGKNV